jgi:MoxR-like ATPase
MAAFAPSRSRLLRALGLAGWDAFEPVLLASLATEEPLLLIGPHGSGKTMLLNRLAEVMGLSHRHYNASILSFDDLVGFPVPKDGGVVYLQTPATVWEAESILIDEISRCRPEVQNKLFPLVHERVVQGLPLPRLKHRWAAMNPPAGLDVEADTPEAGYAGSEPLDVALADRFAFILRVPSLRELPVEDQRRVLLSSPWNPEDVRPALLGVLGRVREELAAEVTADRPAAAEYSILVAAQLESAAHPISTRRAAQLVRNILAVRAASRALGNPDAQEGDYLTALRCSLPDAAWGRPLPFPKLLAVHRSACAAVGLAEGSPRRRLLSEKDPMERMAIALDGGLPPHEAAGVFTDAYTSLPLQERYVAAVVVMPVLSRRRDLPAAALEPVAADWATLSMGRTDLVDIHPGAASWKKRVVTEDLPSLDLKTVKGKLLAAVGSTLLFDGFSYRRADLDAAWERAVAAFDRAGRAAA